MDEPIPTYSISLRLRKTTTEEAFVRVPVTGELIVWQADGTGRIDSDKLIHRAIEIGKDSGIGWQREGEVVEPHPIQTPPPGLPQ
jgi:hypothetical protein